MTRAAPETAVLLAEEQAALRRVATLVASGAAPARVFESVAEEIGRVIGADAAALMRLDLPVEVDVSAERLPGDVEASAYFIIAEALTNVLKHSHARWTRVTATVTDGTLGLEVVDDGVGGADPEGHGLVGVADRVAALGGRLRIESPPGGGTVVTAALPLTR